MRKNHDFLKFWAGETVSLFGSQVTALALPLAAAVTFQASPAQMGILNAASYAPFLLLSLFAGVWIDRVRRRPVLIAVNVGRALLLSLIPLGAFLGLLRIEYLYVIMFLAGMLTVLFDLAYNAYVPSLVASAELVEGNSKLQGSASLAQVSGPALAGMIVSTLTAPVAILLDGVSYLVSALFLGLIRQPEPAPASAVGARGPLWQEIGSGLRFVYGNPYLRAIALEAATYNLTSQITWSVMVLYMTRELKIGPGLMGLIMATASLGSLLGSLVAGAVGRRFGTGRAIIGTMAIACVSPLLLPLAAGPLSVAVPLLVLSFFLGGLGVTTSVVYVVSLRQAMIPPELMGRASASNRFVSWGATPIGALIGGMLGEQIGLRPTLLVGAVGTLCALLWVLLSPVAGLRELPAGAEAGVAAGD